jgi:DNA-directed RNA polymerase specialized sigma24 family protein
VAGDDPVDDALRDLVEMLDANLERIDLIKRRVAEIQRQHMDGRSYTEIVKAAKPPLLVQLITQNKQALDEHSARVRRAEALVLHQEGMTMEEIAERFGVTRQRVSTLLRGARRDSSDS